MGVTHTNILAESKIFLRKVFNRPDVHNFFGYILGVRFHHFPPCNSLVINGLGAEKVINMPFFPKKSYPHGIVHKFWVNYLDISGIFRIFMVVPYIKKTQWDVLSKVNIRNLADNRVKLMLNFPILGDFWEKSGGKGG